MTAASRIITNTLATYLKLIALALSGLFVIPLALKLLGPVDYGIFSVIGGCLTFLMFLNYSLATGAQRHIAYALGEEGKEEAQKWFTASLIVHLVVGVAIAGSALLASNWILYHLLKLPAGRLAAAAWVYRMVVVTMVCDVLSTPYEALLIAHESIASMSLMNSLSCVFFAAAIFWLKYLPGDALLWYAAIYCVFQVSMAAGPAFYCYYRFPESRFSSLRVDNPRRRFRELFSFSGWNLVHVSSTPVRVQGPAVVLNVFFGPVANTAYGLAVQVQAFASNILWSFLGSATPLIVKRQASGDVRGMVRLSNQSNTYGFAILWIALAPVLFETEFCLKLWLHTPPPSTAAFLTPVLIALLVDQLTLGYNVSMLATGRIAEFSLVILIANCVGVAAGYFLLRAGMPSTWILWAIVFVTVLAGGGRLWFARKHAAISISSWLREVVFPAGLAMLGSIAAMLALIRYLADGFARFFLIAMVNSAVVCLVMWFFAATEEQRCRLRTMLVSARTRLSGKSPASTRGVAEETL